MQVTVDKESPSYEGNPDEEYCVPATPLTVLRPEDLGEGLLMYHLEPESQQFLEITEGVDSKCPEQATKRGKSKYTDQLGR
jgi:hypothetical protein